MILWRQRIDHRITNFICYLTYGKQRNFDCFLVNLSPSLAGLRLSTLLDSAIKRSWSSAGQTSSSSSAKLGCKCSSQQRVEIIIKIRRLGRRQTADGEEEHIEWIADGLLVRWQTWITRKQTITVHYETVCERPSITKMMRLTFTDNSGEQRFMTNTRATSSSSGDGSRSWQQPLLRGWLLAAAILYLVAAPLLVSGQLFGEWRGFGA